MDKRLKTILKNVKLGKGFREDDYIVYPLIIKGRNTYGSKDFMKRYGGHRTMVIAQYDDGSFLVSKMVEIDPRMPEWVDMPRKLTNLFRLAFWEKFL